MLRHAGLICGCFVALGFGFPAAAQTVEEAEKKLAESFAKLKSYTAKTKMVQDLDLGEGNKMKSDMDGTIEWSRKGDKALYRSDMKGSSAQTFGGQEMKTDASTTVISDGDVVYTLTDQAGQKMAYKQKADVTIGGDAKSVLQPMREDHTLKLLADEKVDGQDCFVIEAMPKEMEGNPFGKMVLYFRKDAGLNIKVVGRDPKDKTVYTASTTDIKLNPDVDPQRFVFKAPEGVELMDMTKQP